MAQVIDTKGDKRDASRNGIVRGSSHGGNKTDVKSDLVKPDVESESQDRFSSTPFSHAVKRYTSRYTGISGGTPVSAKSNQLQQDQWSPTYASLLKGGEEESDEPKSYWDNMQERVGEEGAGDVGEVSGTEQQSGTSSELAPRIKAGSSWNDVYEKDMLAQGMSQDYIDKVFKDPHGLSTAITDELENGAKPEWSYEDYSMNSSDIDDGTMDKSHLLSDWMTGKQYYHYVHDLGMPGLPEDQIDISDNGRYSKTQERQINGFQPYIPNSSYELAMTLPNIESAVRTFSNYIGNLRTNGLFDDVDYQITTDTGHGTDSFSGRDYEKMLNGYASQVEDLYTRASNGDPEAMSILMSPENHSSPYTTMVRERELPDGSKHYGVVTENYNVNDLTDKDTFDDLVWWGIDENTQASYPDKNGTSTYGNATLNFDSNNNVVSGTLQTKDGFTLNIEPVSNGDGGFQLVTDDDAFNKWWNSHYNGDRYVAFSDGSSAVVSAKDIDKATKENGNWIGDDLVSYDRTSLKDIENFDPTSLTVGNPSSLKDHIDLESGKGSEAGMVYMPDMVLSDGTPISRDVVFNIANDDNPDDSAEDGISYDFELSGVNPLRSLSSLPVPKSFTYPLVPLTWLSNPILGSTDSRPRRLMHDEILDEDGLHLGAVETPNWITDAGLNSIPISLPVYQWLDAYSNATPYFAGIDSSSGDNYGRYQTTGYDPGSEESTVKSISALLGPALENLAGYGHEPSLDPIVEKLINEKFAEGTLPNLFLGKTWDSVGEAIEEIIGNYVDEPGVYGFENAWANPISYPYAGMGKVYDKDHNLLYEVEDDIGDDELSNLYRDMVKNHGENGQFPVLYDEHGREFRDSGTPIGDRISNAFAPTPEHLKETTNSALGGAAVSWLYSMPELMYGLGTSIKNGRKKNDNLSQEEWKIGADNQDMANGTDAEIYVPESVKSDRISSNDYRINPGAPIRFKE